MGHLPLVAADAAQRIVGQVGVGLVAVLVMLATFSTLVGSIFTSPRIFFAMADDGLLFRPGGPGASALSHAVGLDRRDRGARRAVVLLLNFDQLADQFVVAIFPFYALAAAAVFALRFRQPERPRPVKVLGYPIVPLLFILARSSSWGTPSRTSGPTGLAFGGILLGVPAYFAWQRWQRRAPGPKHFLKTE